MIGIGGYRNMRYLQENGMYAVVAEPNMAIKFGDDYCHKLYRKTNNFSDCTEVDVSVVPSEPESE